MIAEGLALDRTGEYRERLVQKQGEVLAGLEGRNRPLAFRLLHLVEFAGDGAIQRENVWVDLAAIQQQLPQG